MILDWKRFLIPYEQAVEELKIKFKSLRNEYRKIGQYSPIEFVTGRVKALSSILEKCERISLALDKIEEMEDIAGIRIICQLEDDIEKVVELIKDRDGKDIDILYIKDYIKNKKTSGYRSYHIIISYTVQTAVGEKKLLAEIQVRTLAMNFWATIEHSLNYKFEKNVPEDIRRRLQKSAEAAILLDKEMSEIKDVIVESQDVFQKRSSLIADILSLMQQFYILDTTKEENREVQEAFWKIKNNRGKEISKFKNQLESRIAEIKLSKRSEE